ncbi:hypothetical protein K3M35_24560 [Rhodococcus sp. DMU2021]|uniref:LGFP repeat-containing protein n=1 Tax=Rhodococcus sp. DMU2021 TaxID=2866997 RepID=UPI001C7CFC44|nr:hypothetical protein [Rhodococcus sp. DMU2021]MBX4171770.1 hypothetical protein [Rhodococcus sp. DMU2021]
MSSPEATAAAPGNKIPYTGKPTENPNATIIPGKMRSDREEVPAPFTKEQADLAETREAQLKTSRAALGCQQFWPSEHWVCGEILNKYLSLGGSSSFLWLPNSPELTNPDGSGKRQQFLKDVSVIE